MGLINFIKLIKDDENVSNPTTVFKQHHQTLNQVKNGHLQIPKKVTPTIIIPLRPEFSLSRPAHKQTPILLTLHIRLRTHLAQLQDHEADQLREGPLSQACIHSKDQT